MTVSVSDEFFAQAFAASRVMGIFRGKAAEETVALCTAAWDAGVPLVEVPVMSRTDISALVAAVDAGRNRGMPVGAGTVISVDMLREVVHHGAAFTVAPGTDLDVLRASREAGVPHLPGVASGTDVTAVVKAGFTWVKAFPAAQLTPAWVAALRAPFPQVNFVATGGVSAANAGDFIAAGCRAVAMGSALNDAQSLERIRPLLISS